MSVEFPIFNKRINLIKKDYGLIDDSVTKMIDNNPFICDGGGVANDWLLNIVNHSLENLIYAVAPSLKEKAIQDIIDYYVWENNFGGEVDGKDLSDNRTFYNYIIEAEKCQK
jgi:hypothetical protein